MKKYSSIEQIEEYFNSSAIDQSRLKRLILGLEGFMDDRESKLYFEEKESFLIGSLVDCILTNHPDDFDKKYYISTLIDKPSDTLKSIVNYVYDRSKENIPEFEVWRKLPLAYHKSVIEEAIELHNYQNNWKQETRINKVLECSAYFEDLKSSSGKNVISLEEYSNAQNIVESLKTIPIIQSCIDETPSFEDNLEIYFQYPIYFEYKGKKAKALLDILIIDKETGEYWIIDIKTTGNKTLNFFESVIKFRYDIQLAFYKQAVYTHFNLKTDSQINCMFAVESTIRQGNPILFKCSENLLKQGRDGRVPIIANGLVVKQALKGFSQLIDIYSYHEENGFTSDKLMKIANEEGYLTLGINGIVEEE